MRFQSHIGAIRIGWWSVEFADGCVFQSHIGAIRMRVNIVLDHPPAPFQSHIGAIRMDFPNPVKFSVK